MSEKLDGIRGYWGGKEMYTKSGKKLFPPMGFTKNFPPIKLKMLPQTRSRWIGIIGISRPLTMRVKPA